MKKYNLRNLFFLLVLAMSNIAMGQNYDQLTPAPQEDRKYVSTSKVETDSSKNANQLQYNKPVVGQPISNFDLKDIHFFDRKSASFNDFKGKWLILDFWTSTCLACFQSFPKLNALQDKFSDKVQFLLIGDNEHKYGKNIKEVYERIRHNMNLNLPVAFDSTLFEKWQIHSVPLTIIIDDKGIVRVVNAIRELNSENLSALIERNDASAFKFVEWVKWDMNKPYLIDGNGGPDNDFEFRSILTKHKRPTRMMIPISITAYNMGKARERKGIQGSGMNLSFMYNLAFFDKHVWFFGDSMYGTHSRLPIFEGIDSSFFVSKPRELENRNLFNYSLSVPDEKANTKFIMEAMQRDLENYFGFTARIETRKMPCWELTSTPEAAKRLKSKGIKKRKAVAGSQLSLGDCPISDLLMVFESYHPNEPPFIDKTGINYNIDIEFNALFTSLEDIQRELRQHGLILKKSEKEMKVIIVRNKKDRL